MKLLDVIRRARKRYRATGNENEAVMAIRMSYPDRSLKDAKDFWDWMKHFETFSATELAKWWCDNHWCQLGRCKCNIEQNNAAGASASAGSKRDFQSGLCEQAIPSPLPSALSSIEANKCLCICGTKSCTDEFHANLTVLVRKHGVSRAVELMYIWMGLNAPENEEQAQMVEAQPGYRPLYQELPQ